MLLNMILTPEFKIPRMGKLVSAIKLDFYGAIDQVLLNQSHYVIASDFNDPINQILVEIEYLHYTNCPEESFVATVSPDNISVFFLDRNQISNAELAVHLSMTPEEFKKQAPNGFIFIASEDFRERFQEFFEEERIFQVPSFGNPKSIH